ncbi:MAG: ATP-binding protein [Thiobacillus sp.]
MGIGAYECRETLHALGGTIEVDSTPGSGTRFRLGLPLDNNAYAGGDAA